MFALEHVCLRSFIHSIKLQQQQTTNKTKAATCPQTPKSRWRAAAEMQFST